MNDLEIEKYPISWGLASHPGVFRLLEGSMGHDRRIYKVIMVDVHVQKVLVVLRDQL